MDEGYIFDIKGKEKGEGVTGVRPIELFIGDGEEFSI